MFTSVTSSNVWRERAFLINWLLPIVISTGYRRTIIYFTHMWIQTLAKKWVFFCTFSVATQDTLSLICTSTQKNFLCSWSWFQMSSVFSADIPDGGQFDQRVYRHHLPGSRSPRLQHPYHVSRTQGASSSSCFPIGQSVPFSKSSVPYWSVPRTKYL